jgi:glycosyltransferase involved in cell wall biosynthesis
MKILILHNAYQQKGGEDAVVDAETSLLRENGHEVLVKTLSNDRLDGFGAKFHTFMYSPYDPARRLWTRDLVRTHRPDVVHIHNFFPQLTPAAHEGASEAGAAVVQTLHNFRLLCANALFLREGAICEKCVGGTPFWAVAHRCYRGSASASLAVVRMQARARRAATWTKHVDRFIALTEFARSKFITGGIPAEAIVVKPNFVAHHETVAATTTRRAVFVGRLAPEKGVQTLISAWREMPELPLVVIGDGPERTQLEAAAPSNVRFLGAVTPAAVRAEIAGSICLIVPSICYETFGLVAVEAFQLGVPVIASGLGGLAEIVRPNVNGLHFDAGSPASLVAAVKQLQRDSPLRARLSAGARADYSTLYSPETNLRQLLAIYHEAAEARARKRV